MKKHFIFLGAPGVIYYSWLLALIFVAFIIGYESNKSISYPAIIFGAIFMVLVMSVHPGFGGQKFIPGALEKVKWLKDARKEKGLDYKIEIDGGVNKSNIAEISQNGVDIIVAGTAVFGGNITENINSLKEVL